MRYRKRPIPVSAVQWTGENLDEMTQLAGFNFSTIDPEDREDDPEMTGQVLDSLHSTWIPMRTGDWVIRGIKGEFYPCNAEVFAQSYEPMPE